ncbi:TPA: hypothetical protein ACH3X1_013009 [Trebouxia sp. C0004]
MAQEARRLELPEPALLIVSANRAPHLAASHHDVDPTILHTLTYTDFWTAFEHRYGTIPDLVVANKLLPVSAKPALRRRDEPQTAPVWCRWITQ